MQRRHVAGQTPLTPDADDFDMWHDYMSLGLMVDKLCSEEEEEIEDGYTSNPQLRHISGNRRRTCHSEEDKDSIETGTLSPSSSLSDTTRSLTSGYNDTCGFCKQNGESAEIYRSHGLKSRDGKVICPILRNYTCPICDATGDYAHTRRYCPQLQRQEDGMVALESKYRGTVQCQ